MRVPLLLGKNVQEFISEWSLNCPLDYPESEIASALSTLEKYWPEHIEAKAKEATRGFSIAAALVELGRILETSENKNGFSKVLDRLKNERETRSAHSELILVDYLERNGFVSNLETPLNGRVLDAMCQTEIGPVYFEAIAPESGEVNTEKLRASRKLSQNLTLRFYACRIEISLHAEFSDEKIPQLLSEIESCESQKWIEIPGCALFRKVVKGERLPKTFDGDGPTFSFAAEKDVQGDSFSAPIRFESEDERAKRFLNDEYKHFSESVPNILFVQGSAIAGDLKDWGNQMKRLFQPDRNRKIGAVVLYHQAMGTPFPVIKRDFRVIANPHARVQIPMALLNIFKKNY